MLVALCRREHRAEPARGARPGDRGRSPGAGGGAPRTGSCRESADWRRHQPAVSRGGARPPFAGRAARRGARASRRRPRALDRRLRRSPAAEGAPRADSPGGRGSPRASLISGAVSARSRIRPVHPARRASRRSGSSSPRQGQPRAVAASAGARAARRGGRLHARSGGAPPRARACSSPEMRTGARRRPPVARDRASPTAAASTPGAVPTGSDASGTRGAARPSRTRDDDSHSRRRDGDSRSRPYPAVAIAAPPPRWR